MMQLASVTGMSGISFIIAWFATVAARVWDLGIGSSQTPEAVVVLALAMIAVTGRNRVDVLMVPRVGLAGDQVVAPPAGGVLRDRERGRPDPPEPSRRVDRV